MEEKIGQLFTGMEKVKYDCEHDSIFEVIEFEYAAHFILKYSDKRAFKRE